MNKKRVLAGMRSTGRLHLGNYLGSARGMLALQEDPNYETLYMVADLHAITTPYDKDKLSESTRNVILDYLSVGLDPEKSIIFVDSHIPEVTELSYLLSSVVTIARMQHLPTFKEKVKQYPEGSTMALLNYPVLMAADILLYKAHEVPVGDDQLPHLEVAREIARKMNDIYKMDFPEPKPFKTEAHYVPSLTGEGKMSKSVEGSYISLTDSLEEIKTKLSKVPTDLGKGNKIPEKGGVVTLMILTELFLGKERRKQIEKMYVTDGVKYSQTKEELSQAIARHLEPIQTVRKELEAKPDYLDKIVTEGAEKARKIAKETIKEVKEKMGFLSLKDLEINKKSKNERR